MKVAGAVVAFLVLLAAGGTAAASPYLWVLTQDGGDTAPALAIALVAVPSGRVVCERRLAGVEYRGMDLFWLSRQGQGPQLCALLWRSAQRAPEAPRSARGGATEATDLRVIDLEHLRLGRQLWTKPVLADLPVPLPRVGRLGLSWNEESGRPVSRELQFDNKWRVVSELDAEQTDRGTPSPDGTRLWMRGLRGGKHGGLREVDVATGRELAKYRLPSADWSAEHLLPLAAGGALVAGYRAQEDAIPQGFALFLCRAGEVRRLDSRAFDGYFQLAALAEDRGAFWVGLAMNTSSPRLELRSLADGRTRLRLRFRDTSKEIAPQYLPLSGGRYLVAYALSARRTNGMIAIADASARRVRYAGLGDRPVTALAATDLTAAQVRRLRHRARGD